MESFQTHDTKKSETNEDRRKHNIGPGNGQLRLNLEFQEESCVNF
jgi:hypothetical protein